MVTRIEQQRHHQRAGQRRRLRCQSSGPWPAGRRRGQSARTPSRSISVKPRPGTPVTTLRLMKHQPADEGQRRLPLARVGHLHRAVHREHQGQQRRGQGSAPAPWPAPTAGWPPPRAATPRPERATSRPSVASTTPASSVRNTRSAGEEGFHRRPRGHRLRRALRACAPRGWCAPTPPSCLEGPPPSATPSRPRRRAPRIRSNSPRAPMPDTHQPRSTYRPRLATQNAAAVRR